LALDGGYVKLHAKIADLLIRLTAQDFASNTRNTDCSFDQNHHVIMILWHIENTNTVYCFEHNCTEPKYKLWKVNNF
jgi:hypothetical protein